MFIRAFAAAMLVAVNQSNGFSFELQAHRGARGLMPENTLPAFAYALSIGVTTLELDTVITKDGVVVVSHNPTIGNDLARGTDGKWLAGLILINTLTFAQLQKYDVGRLNPDSRSASRFTQQQGIDNTPIPSLQQVFNLVKRSGNNDVKFNIETKINPLKPADTPAPEDFVSALLEVVETNAMSGRVAIQSFDWRTLQIVQSKNPHIETVYLSAQQSWLDNVSAIGGKPSKWTAGYNLEDHEANVAQMIKAAGGKIWSPYYRDLSPALIKRAQNLGLKVIPWTVNDESSMSRLIKLGVDGIITDFPDRLRKVMAASSLQLPSPTPVKP